MVSGTKYIIPQNKKVVATFLTWFSEIVEFEIDTEMIDDIVSAVQGQYSYTNNVKGFTIRGFDFKHVDIWVADKDYVLKNYEGMNGKD